MRLPVNPPHAKTPWTLKFNETETKIEILGHDKNPVPIAVVELDGIESEPNGRFIICAVNSHEKFETDRKILLQAARYVLKYGLDATSKKMLADAIADAEGE